MELRLFIIVKIKKWRIKEVKNKERKFKLKKEVIDVIK